MNKNLLLIPALFIGVAWADEYKNGNGGVSEVTGEMAVDSPTYSGYNVSGKGGVFYVADGGNLTLTGDVDFYGNYHDAEIIEGTPFGTENDVYLAKGGQLNVTASINSNMYVDTQSKLHLGFSGGSLSGVNIKDDVLSGSLTDAYIQIENYFDFDNLPVIYLSDVQMTNSIVFVDGTVIADATAGGITLDVYSTLSGNVKLGGSNSLTLDSTESYHLSDVTLVDGSALTLNFTDASLLETSEVVTLTFHGLFVEAGADISFELVDTDYAVSEYEITDSGINVSITVAPVPEPATATLSVLALMGMAARRRRKM